MHLRLHFRGAVLAALAVFTLARAWADTSAPGTGRLEGLVSNAASGAALAGADVTLPGHRETLTDSSGHYVFRDLPAGNYNVSVSYTGMNTEAKSAAVAAGDVTNLDFPLTSEIMRLEAMTVTTQLEGNAAAITKEHNAPSVSATASFDAFGNLSNNEIGELLIRLPGVEPDISGEGIVSAVAIRGTDPTLNTFTMDGNLMESTGGLGRNYTTNQLPGPFFDTVTVTYAPTPDMDAGSLGGNVEMSTRNALAMATDQELSFQLGDKWAAPFFAHTPYTRSRPQHPLAYLGLGQIFDVFGGHHNLGISLNVSYSENATDVNQVAQGYAAASALPAQQTGLTDFDSYDNRKVKSVLLRADYRFTDHLSAYFTAMYNNEYEPGFRYFEFVTSNPVSAIAAGSNYYVENVNPTSSSNVALNSQSNRFEDNQRQLHFDATQSYDRLKINYDGSYSISHVRQDDLADTGGDSGGVFIMTDSNVGWQLNKTENPAQPTWTQTAGPSIYNIANYSSGTTTLNKKNDYRNGWMSGGSGYAQYNLDDAGNFFIKAGGGFRRQLAETIGGDRQWDYIGPAASLQNYLYTGVAPTSVARYGPLPFVDIYKASADVSNSSLWTEDTFYGESRKFLGTAHVVEDVTNSYLMASGTVGHFRALVGVRNEYTTDDTQGYLTAPVLATTAQIPDNVQRAIYDYDLPEHTYGDYDKWYPGVYLTYNFTKNFLARADWSNSIGRPAFSALVPAETVNESAQTVTVSNPGVRPQFSRNLDASLEYYFEPVGLLTAGVFQKNIKDFLVTESVGTVGTGSNNGYAGQYAGYDLITTLNGGDAVIRGLQLAYQQRLTFLPGFLSGIGLLANYTRLTSEGNYGTIGPRTTELIPNFVPKSGNAGVFFNFWRFKTQLLENYTGEYLIAYSATASLNNYVFPRTTTNVNVNFVLTRHLELYCDLENLLNEKQERFTGFAGDVNDYAHNGAWFNFGITGHF